MRRKFFTHVDGGPSRGSSVRRPGSEDLHWHQRKVSFFHNHIHQLSAPQSSIGSMSPQLFCSCVCASIYCPSCLISLLIIFFSCSAIIWFNCCCLSIYCTTIPSCPHIPTIVCSTILSCPHVTTFFCSTIPRCLHVTTTVCSTIPS